MLAAWPPERGLLVTEFCALGGAPDLASISAAWAGAVMIWSAMVAAVMAPAAAPWRRLTSCGASEAGVWRDFAAYVGVWLAAGVVGGAVETAVRALAGIGASRLVEVDVLAVTLVAAAGQRLWPGVRPVSADDLTCAKSDRSEGRGVAAGLACVRSNALAMAAMCLAGGENLGMFALLVAAMACEPAAPPVIFRRLSGSAFACASVWAAFA